jgi:hypothetical protein
MRIGVGLLVGFALLASLRLLGRSLRERGDIGRTDEITSYEARFRELRQALPPRARLGYVTDSRPRPADGDDGPRLAFKRYLLAQYALLPALVLPDAKGPLVVGDFDASSKIDSVATRGLTLIRDFGNGVMLFRTSAE